MADSHDAAGQASTSSTPIQLPGPTSLQSSLIAGQSFILFPTFTLESGVILHDLPLAYKTWGTLDPVKKNNALIVCHALSGSADVEDWWGPLLGPGKLFDPTRFFIVCANVLGSPYGSGGPCTRKQGDRNPPLADWNGEGWWGPEFPATTVRDDVRITKQLLDHLGIEQIAAVVGGSMGGMSVLEWPLLFPVRFPQNPCIRAEQVPSSPQKPYIRSIIPLATAARHSAWCISWAEAQRQSIYSDPAYNHGYYSASQPPRAGLAAARMAALLTYRSRDSFENRFGRRLGGPNKGGGVSWKAAGAAGSPQGRTQMNGNGASASISEQAVLMHNEGNQSPRIQPQKSSSSLTTASLTAGANAEAKSIPEVPSSTVLPSPATASNGAVTNGSSTSDPISQQKKPFSAQSYLRYQGDKFVKRFDANCYVHLTRKMDAHDVARGRAHWGLKASSNVASDTAEPIEVDELERQRGQEQDAELEVTPGERRLPREGEEDDEALQRVLSLLSQDVYRHSAPAPSVLIVSVESDGLFAPPEQELLHRFIVGSSIVNIQSPDGHDGFLLEFEQINQHAEAFLKASLADIYEGQGVGCQEWKDWGKQTPSHESQQGGEKVVKESMSGEVEDLTRW